MDIRGMTVREVEQWMEQQIANEADLPDELLRQLENDHRTGVKRLWERWEKAKQRRDELREQWRQMSRLEQNLWQQGYSHVAGVDEVGRGPLAGPVVTAAVILPQDYYLPGLNDSKKVPPAMREAFYEHIVSHAISIGMGISSVETIDEINIYQATLRAMKEAVNQLDPAPEMCLNDAVTIPGVAIPQVPVIGGDGKSVTIAAASIVAKVTRDRMMEEYAKHYPQYGFEKNAGYGTPEHCEALKQFGPCPLHRRSFKPVSDLIGE